MSNEGEGQDGPLFAQGAMWRTFRKKTRSLASTMSYVVQTEDVSKETVDTLMGKAGLVLDLANEILDAHAPFRQQNDALLKATQKLGRVARSNAKYERLIEDLQAQVVNLKAKLSRREGSPRPMTRHQHPAVQRCSLNNKVRFTSARAAKANMRTKSASLRPYRCPVCGDWHLTKRD